MSFAALLPWLAQRWYLVVIAALGVWVAVQQIELAHAEAKIESQKAEAARIVAEERKALLDRQEADAQRNQALSQLFAATVSNLNLSLDKAHAAIVATGSTMDCTKAGAARAYTGGVRQPAGNPPGPVRAESPRSTGQPISLSR